MMSVRSVFLMLLCHMCRANLSNEECLPEMVFSKEGDINIGALVHLHRHSQTTLCSKRISSIAHYQFSHAIAYGVEQINNRDDILPNVTLGYTVADTCYGEIPAVGATMQFMDLKDEEYKDKDVLSIKNQYDVVAVIGPMTSQNAIVLGSIHSFFEVPLLGVLPTANELNDRTKYPYFYRIIPPNLYQAEAVISFLKDQGLTYFSIMHSEATLEYEANRDLHYWAKLYGICVDKVYPVSDVWTKYNTYHQEYDEIIQKMRASQSKAIVMFVNPQCIRSWKDALKTNNAVGEFIFIISECFSDIQMQSYAHYFPGSFRVGFYNYPEKDFETYTRQMNPENARNDPNLPEVYEQTFGCTYNVSDMNKPNCAMYTSLADSPLYYYHSDSVRWIDGAYVLAYAIDAMINDVCPEARGNKQMLRKCVNPQILIDYIQNVQVVRPSGVIEFDKYGSSMRTYVINQIQFDDFHRSSKFNYSIVAFFDPLKKRLTYNDKTEVVWNRVKLSELEMRKGQPESVCSKPCGPGEIYIQGEVICCWECGRCRENEIPVNNASSCEACEDLTWPDETTNFTSCLSISPYHLTWDHPYCQALMAVACIGIVLAICVTGLIVNKRERKIIKGSSCELLSLILFGVVAAFLAVPLFITKPTDSVCWSCRLGFNLSITLVFAPLCMKTIRIYRVFKVSEGVQVRISYFGVHHQIGLALGAFIVQVGVCFATCLTWWPRAELLMPVKTNKYVELKCTWGLYAMLLPLSYNLFLLLISAVFSFLSRKLTDNYNESWYIFICVCTTLFIWIALIPTYFAAFYAYHQAVLLALALILNVLVVLICLFGPKIYALYRVDEKDIKISIINGKRY